MAEPVTRSPRRRIVAAGQKSYLGYAQTLAWLDAVADTCRRHADEIDVVVFPVAPALPAAVAFGRRSGFQVGAQDVSDRPPGAFTGELPAALLAELGVRFVEMGHAERRYLFGEPPELIARKIAASTEHGLTPLICVGEGRLGETTAFPAETALLEAAAQLADVLGLLPATSPFVVAYEPVWAIGAARPAPIEHIRGVTDGLRRMLDAFPAARLIYGGTAGPGLFGELGDSVDGLFLGRRAHDPAAFAEVVSEVASGTSTRR